MDYEPWHFLLLPYDKHFTIQSSEKQRAEFALDNAQDPIFSELAKLILLKYSQSQFK